MKEPCRMEEERDQRFRRLSIVGTLLIFIATIFALVSVVSYQWATFSEPTRGYMGPFVVCQDIPGGRDRCERGGLGPYKQTLTSYVAGAGAILALISLAVGLLLGGLIVMMHSSRHEICLKFRHAIFGKLVVIATAAFTSLIACISFMVEARVFFLMQNDDPANLSWSFYLQVITFVVATVEFVVSSYEWHLARKLGGDPTVYARDPEGARADTIVNPNFRDGPRTGPSSRQNGGMNSHRKEGRGLSGGRALNGVAMTKMSGLPYTMTAGGVGNGHLPNGQPRGLVPFDPKKTPLRSSLRRPKPHQANGVGGGGSGGTEDTTDSPTAGVVLNPTFASTSPTPKKKVRIHTQSTAV